MVPPTVNQSIFTLVNLLYTSYCPSHRLVFYLTLVLSGFAIDIHHRSAIHSCIEGFMGIPKSSILNLGEGVVEGEGASFFS